jgi:hypothetical protein
MNDIYRTIPDEIVQTIPDEIVAGIEQDAGDFRIP